MKALALFLAVAVGCASPESRPGPRLPTRVELSTIDRAAKRAVRRRNIGIALAVPGIATSVLGWVVFTYGWYDPNIGQAGGGASELAAGSVLGIIGLVAIPAALLWMSGQDEMDSLKWRREQLLTPLPDASARPKL
jgi:hypothetical protein